MRGTGAHHSSMAMLPFSQIFFYLAMQFMPVGTQQFTIAAGTEPKITFTRQADDTWTGTSGNNPHSIIFSAKDSVVTVAAGEGQKRDIDVSTFVNVATDADKKKTVTLGGKPITVTVNPDATTVTFLVKENGGTAEKPVVITFFAKAQDAGH